MLRAVFHEHWGERFHLWKLTEISCAADTSGGVKRIAIRSLVFMVFHEVLVILTKVTDDTFYRSDTAVVRKFKSIENGILAVGSFFFHQAFGSLPHETPFEHKPLEAIAIELEGRKEANHEVLISHLVDFAMSVEKREVASNGKEKVVVPWWQRGESILERFGNRDTIAMLLVDGILKELGKDLIIKIPKPLLEQGANGVGIIEVFLFEKVDVTLCRV